MLSSTMFETYVTVEEDGEEFETMVEVNVEGYINMRESFHHEFGTQYHYSVENVEIISIYNVSSATEITFGNLKKYDKKRLKDLAKDKLVELEEVYDSEI